MKSVITLFLLAILMLFKNNTYGQTLETDSCYSYNFEKFSSASEVNFSDSNSNCLELYNASSYSDLKDFLEKYPYKNKIRSLRITEYDDRILPETIENYTNLKAISIMDCPELNYKKLFHDLKEIEGIEEIYLINNGMADVPVSVKNIDHLKILCINNYDYLDGNFLLKNLLQNSNLIDLTISSIGDLDLNEDEVFPENLKKLDLSDNSLTFIPKGISKLKNLQTLNVSGSSLDNMNKVLDIIDSLPLQEFSITCLKKSDSVRISKKLKNLHTEISVFIPSAQSISVAKAKVNQAIPTAVKTYYQNQVNPVSENLDVPLKKISIQSNKQENKVYYNSGTTITIPANAFIDSKGNPVTDHVDLYYREFGDVVNIVSSGVPMSYDSAGQKEFFKTAGMLEIYATKDNEVLQLAKDKKINVDLNLIDTSSGFNLYRLDPQTGNWNYTSSLTSDKKNSGPEYSNAYRLYYSILRNNYDTLSFEERYSDSSYARTSRIGFRVVNNKIEPRYQYFRLKRDYEKTKDKNLRKLPRFRFDLFSNVIFKEWSQYRGYIWVYNGPLTRKEFQKKYITKKKWTDLRIDYDQALNQFSIDLKSPNGDVTLDAYPIKYSFPSDIEKLVPLYTRLDKKYKNNLKKTAARFNHRVEQKDKVYLKTLWKRIYAMMTPKEKAMSYDEWIAYAKDRMKKDKEELAKMGSTFSLIAQSFSMDGFGIWNCDQIYRYRNPVNIIANFVDQQGKPLNVSRVNVVDAKVNGVMSFNSTGNVSNIIIDITSQTAIFVQCNDGSIGLVNNQKVASTLAGNSSNKITFIAFETNPDIMTINEIREKLGF